MIIYSLRLAIFGSRFHPVRCRCYHPSWLDKSQRTLLWGLPDLSPQDTRTCWLSGEQVSLRNLLFFGKVGRSLYSITALFWRREARRLVLSERSQQRFCLENIILFISFHDLRLLVSLGLHNSIRHGIFWCFATVVQRSLSKSWCKGKMRLRSLSA